MCLNLAGAAGASLTSSRKGTVASVPDHCIRMMCLSLFNFIAYQLEIYHLLLFLLVKFVANTSALVGFYWWMFLFLLPYSFLPSQTEVAELTMYFFSLSVSFPSSAVFFWVVAICSFFFWCFLPYCCFNNVKSQVLACSLWLLSICFSCSIFLAAVLSLCGFLVLDINWYQT